MGYLLHPLELITGWSTNDKASCDEKVSTVKDTKVNCFVPISPIKMALFTTAFSTGHHVGVPTRINASKPFNYKSTG